MRAAVAAARENMRGREEVKIGRRGSAADRIGTEV